MKSLHLLSVVLIGFVVGCSTVDANDTFDAGTDAAPSDITESAEPDTPQLDASDGTDAAPSDITQSSEPDTPQLDASDTTEPEAGVEDVAATPVTYGLPNLFGDRSDSVLPAPGDVAVQPAVAVDTQGRPIVVFTAISGSEGELGIYASFDGGLPIALKTAPAGQRNEPAVCHLTGGGFVAVWSYDGQASGGTLGVEGALLDADAEVVRTFDVKTEVEGNHWLGHVACSPTGGFTVVGSRTDTDDTTFGIFAQRFDVDAEPIGGAFGVNPSPEGTQVKPVVGLGPDGLGVVVYEDAPTDGYYALSARVIDSDGPAGERFTLLASAGLDCMRPAVAVSKGGVVAYAGNVGVQVSVSVAESLQDANLRETWLNTTGSKGLPSLTFLDRDDVVALAMIHSISGSSIPMVEVQLLAPNLQISTESLMLGDDPNLPPYPPSIAYGGGTLAVAWTERTEAGFEIHLSQFQAPIIGQ